MAVPTMITEEQNAMLAAEFVEVEVDEALGQMEPLKARAPTGYLHCFTKNSGHLLGKMFQVHS